MIPERGSDGICLRFVCFKREAGDGTSTWLVDE